MKEETPALVQPPAQGPSASPGQTEASSGGRESPPAPPLPPSQAPKSVGDGRSSGGTGWAVLLAALALCVAGLAGWQMWEMRDQVAGLRAELANRLNAGESIATEARAISRQQQEAIAGLQGKLGALESQVEATEGQAAALETLYQQFSRSREDGIVAEVEQAVTIAAQQLQLAGNIEAALIALQGAESRLAMHDRGQLAPLRRALASDIEQLRQQPMVDVPGMALRLERLLERADALPLAFAGEPEARQDEVGTEAGAPGGADVVGFVRELALDVWRDLRTLVRVERLDQAAEPALLAPAQSAFLRENLKIRLLTARLALLARDGRTYAADLGQARSWVERFFDTRDPGVSGVLDELRALEAMPVAVEPLGLTNSFGALRMLQSRNGGETERAPLPNGTQNAPPPLPPVPANGRPDASAPQS